MNRLFAIFAVVGSLVLTACSTVPQEAFKVEVENTRVYNNTFDTVWQSIVGSIADSNFQVTTIEKSSGIIAIHDQQYNSFDAIEGRLGSTLGTLDKVLLRRASINVFATRKGDNASMVRVNVATKILVRTGNGSNAFPYMEEWRQTYSNGNIELFMFSNINRRLLTAGQ